MVPLKNCKSLYQNMGGGGGGGGHTSESLVRELLETPLRRRLGARRQVSAVLQVRAASRAEDVSAARRPRPWRSDAENRLAEGRGENVAGRGSELDQRGAHRHESRLGEGGCFKTHTGICRTTKERYMVDRRVGKPALRASTSHRVGSTRT